MDKYCPEGCPRQNCPSPLRTQGPITTGAHGCRQFLLQPPEIEGPRRMSPCVPPSLKLRRASYHHPGEALAETGRRDDEKRKRQHNQQIRLPEQPLPICGKRVKRNIAENQKYFALPEVRLELYKLHPVPTRGALAIATNAGRGAMDVEAPRRKA